MSSLQYPSGVKAIFFDFMGTCLDWYSSINVALPAHLDGATKTAFAIDWREAFFEDIYMRFQNNLQLEPFDATIARLFEPLCRRHGYTFTLEEKSKALQAWHSIWAWDDVASSLAAIKSHGVEIFVLANGTTRLQLDLVQSSGLQMFDMLLSSELLEISKPNPKIYQKAMQLVGVKPEECAMVAAHAYDLRAAKAVGMKTVYIRRWTEDTREDMGKIAEDVDVFIGSITDAEVDDKKSCDGVFYTLPVVLGLVPSHNTN